MLSRMTERPQAGAALPRFNLGPVLAVRVDVLAAGRGEPGEVLPVIASSSARLFARAKEEEEESG
jgi:hypothetical protein